MLQIYENFLLAPLTTLRVGGPARFFTEVRDPVELAEALSFAETRSGPVFILGGGSNLLVSDQGFDGLVIRVVPLGVDVSDADGSQVLLKAASGEDWDSLVLFAVRNGFGGIENLSGIPGLVGGTPVQNVGAYGQEVSDTISEVECFDRSSGTVINLSNAECGFSYRQSIYNSTRREQYIVMAVTFALKCDAEPNISYKDLQTAFAGRKPGLAEVREAVLAIRRAKSMVIQPDDPNRMSAGSFFKNPVVTTARFDELKDEWPGIPSFPFAENVKIPAAWLIENAGFHKGFRLGNAGISTNHTLALINHGGASSAEIIELKDRIQGAVMDRFAIELAPEPVFVGFQNDQ